MINSKEVIERLDSNPEINFSNDKNLMSIAETVRDWLEDTRSEAKTVERILTHQTLNDYEKAAGLFFLGSVVASHIFISMQHGGMEPLIKHLIEKMNE